jgi:hypothetical protein
MLIDRRKFITGTVAITLLAGRKPRSVHAVASLAREANETSEAILFPPDRLAPELPKSDQTPDEDFPCYFQSASMPVAATNWTSKVDGLIQRPLILRLDSLVPA